MILRGAVLICAALVSTAALADPAALDWYSQQAGAPRKAELIGIYAADDDQMIGADPLTFDGDDDWPYFTIPRAPAQFYVLREPEQGRVAAAFLIYSDAAPVCGEGLNVMGVDTGTGAFLTRAAAQKLAQFSDDYDDQGLDTFSDYFDAPDQIGDSIFARFLSLPDGTRFPGFSTGWGDGGYMASRLVDAAGQTVAIYADFIGNEVTQDWIDPPDCGTS